jgi:hypothetical protein
MQLSRMKSELENKGRSRNSAITLGVVESGAELRHSHKPLGGMERLVLGYSPGSFLPRCCSFLVGHGQSLAFRESKVKQGLSLMEGRESKTSTSALKPWVSKATTMLKLEKVIVLQGSLLHVRRWHCSPLLHWLTGALSCFPSSGPDLVTFIHQILNVAKETCLPKWASFSIKSFMIAHELRCTEFQTTGLTGLLTPRGT